MNNDLISRNYVENIVKAEFVDLQDGTEGWRTYVNDTCENILNKVHNAPTVDAIVNIIEVRPQGEWILVDDTEKFIVKCSVCGRIEDSRMVKFYPFCHCGARMKGSEK